MAALFGTKPTSPPKRFWRGYFLLVTLGLVLFFACSPEIIRSLSACPSLCLYEDLDFLLFFPSLGEYIGNWLRHFSCQTKTVLCHARYLPPPSHLPSSAWVVFPSPRPSPSDGRYPLDPSAPVPDGPETRIANILCSAVLEASHQQILNSLIGAPLKVKRQCGKCLATSTSFLQSAKSHLLFWHSIAKDPSTC